MNSIFVCVVAIFGITLALPVNNEQEALLQRLFITAADESNSLLETALINALEGFRQTMVTGSDDVPVLDPFYHDHISLDDSVIPLPGARVAINDLTVSKLSTFEINTVSISIASIWLQRYDAVIDIEVPAVEVDVGNYDLFVSTNGLSIFGNGDAKIILFKPRVKVELLVGLRPRLGIYLNILDTRIEVSVSDLQPEIRGMFNNPIVDSFVNLFLKNLVLELLDTFSEEITQTISPLVQDLANDVLDDINLISIFG